MSKRKIVKIRNAIRSGNYDLTYHANEEMAEDHLSILDVESTILSGKITRSEKDDPRGIKYTIEGVGVNKSTYVGIVGRFKETGVFLIITVYQIN